MSVQQLEHIYGSTEAALQDLQTQFLPHAIVAAPAVRCTESGLPILTNIDAAERRFYAGENAEVIGVLQVFDALRLRISTIPSHMITAHKTVPIQLELGYRYSVAGDLRAMPLEEVGALQVTMVPHNRAFQQKYVPKHWVDGGVSLEPALQPDGSHSLSQQNISRLSDAMLRIADTKLVMVGSRT